jgi:Condensation domain
MTDRITLAIAADPVKARPEGMAELPLSPQQKRWWFLCTAYPGASSPVLLAANRLRGPLNIEAWRRAVAAVVDRHEGLRARFIGRDGSAVQIIDPPRGLDVEYIDLTDLSEDAREEQARALLNERWQRLLDLERDPLVEACLVKLGIDDHVWFLKLHHILADGVSLAIIQREIGMFYAAFVDGTTPALPKVRLHYGDFAVWYDTVRPNHDDDLRYWLERLDGVPPLELPTDVQRPASKGAPSAEVINVIDATVIRRVDELATASGCTRFMVLLAAFQALLGRFSRQYDFCIGVPVVGLGRTRAELAPVVGLFANTLALRCDLSGDPTFAEILDAAADHMFDALDYQGIPFSRVMAELTTPQVFQTLFLYEDYDRSGGMSLPGLAVDGFALTMPKILHDLMVFAQPDGPSLSVRFVYDTALFTESTMTALNRGYEDLLRVVLDRPESRLSTL